MSTQTESEAVTDASTNTIDVTRADESNNTIDMTRVMRQPIRLTIEVASDDKKTASDDDVLKVVDDLTWADLELAESRHDEGRSVRRLAVTGGEFDFADHSVNRGRQTLESLEGGAFEDTRMRAGIRDTDGSLGRRKLQTLSEHEAIGGVSSKMSVIKGEAGAKRQPGLRPVCRVLIRLKG